MRRFLWFIPAMVAFVAVASCLNMPADFAHVDRVKRLLKGGADVEGAITNTKTTATMSIVSNTADSTTSGTVGSITLKAGANITATDLVLDVQDSSGNHAFTCTEAGVCTALSNMAMADLTLSGNDLTASGTGQTFNIVSAANDATTSGTVGAVTIKASADITDTDLVLDVQNSAGGHAFTVNEQGELASASSKMRGSATIGGDGGIDVAVNSGAYCVCTGAGGDVVCSVSSTTLTISGAPSTAATYVCFQ